MKRRLLPVVAVLLFAGGVALAILGARAIDLERGAAERELTETARKDLAAANKRLATLGPPENLAPDEEWLVSDRPPDDLLAGAPEETRLRFEEAAFRERHGEEKAALEILSRIAAEPPEGEIAYLAALRGGALALRLGDPETARRLLTPVAASPMGLRTPEGPRMRIVARRHLAALDLADGRGDWLTRLVSTWGANGPELAKGDWLDDGDVFQAFAAEIGAMPPSKVTLESHREMSAAVLASARIAARGHAALAGLGTREFAVVDGVFVARGGRVLYPETPSAPVPVLNDRLVAYSPATLSAWLGARVPSMSTVLGLAASPADVPDGAESTPAPAPFEGLTLYAMARPPLSPSSGAPWVLAAGILAYAVGGGVSLVATARARRAARMQADFVAAVSHEMKTPIAAVQAMAEMLADERVPDPARARAYAERMRAEMVRLGATVRNVLDAARIERGEGARVAPRPMDPATVVEDLTAVVRPVLEARGYRFLVAATPAPQPVATDPDALANVLTNLLDNAAKFAAAGREVAVEAGPTETGYRIAVLDRGPGVPEADRERVFERFWRGRGAKEGAVPGVGLGLHVARELVQAHGGTIRVEAREGGGASFVVEWPREGAA